MQTSCVYREFNNLSVCLWSLMTLIMSTLKGHQINLSDIHVTTKHTILYTGSMFDDKRHACTLHSYVYLSWKI